MVESRILQPLAGVISISRHFSLDPTAKEIQNIPNILAMISVVIVAAAFPLVALISAMVTHERQREIGLLKAIGAKQRAIFIIVISESLVLSVIGGIAGVGASMGILYFLDKGGFLGSALQVMFRLPAPAQTVGMAAIALSVVIVIGSAASILPAYWSSRISPYDAIRFGK